MKFLKQCFGYYLGASICAFILFIFLLYLVASLVFPNIWFDPSFTIEKTSLLIMILVFGAMLCVLIMHILNGYNSTYEGLLVDKLSQRHSEDSSGIHYYIKLEANRKIVRKEVKKQQYCQVEVGDYVTKKSGTFELSVSPNSYSVERNQ